MKPARIPALEGRGGNFLEEKKYLFLVIKEDEGQFPEGTLGVRGEHRNRIQVAIMTLLRDGPYTRQCAQFVRTTAAVRKSFIIWYDGDLITEAHAKTYQVSRATFSCLLYVARINCT